MSSHSNIAVSFDTSRSNLDVEAGGSQRMGRLNGHLVSVEKLENLGINTWVLSYALMVSAGVIGHVASAGSSPRCEPEDLVNVLTGTLVLNMFLGAMGHSVNASVRKGRAGMTSSNPPRNRLVVLASEMTRKLIMPAVTISLVATYAMVRFGIVNCEGPEVTLPNLYAAGRIIALTGYGMAIASGILGSYLGFTVASSSSLRSSVVKKCCPLDISPSI